MTLTQPQNQTPTLAETLVPVQGIGRELIRLVAFSALIGLAARIEIPLPFTPVPLTGQTFGVLLTGLTLGSRRGAAALALYLLEGMAGLPVFSGGGAGLHHLVGPTGGYLVAFPLAAFATGSLAERGWDRKPLTAFCAMLLGSLVIFALGATWLSGFVGGAAPAVVKGVLPFLPGDVVKSTLAAVALPLAWRLAGRQR